MIFKGFSGKQSCHVFGQIGGKCHLSSGYRMEKAKTVRVKRLPVDQFHIRIVPNCTLHSPSQVSVSKDSDSDAHNFVFLSLRVF